MRIVLVDDHPIVRKGLKSLLEEQPGFRVVGEAGAGAEAVRLCRALRPDVGIFDLKLPDMSGIDVAVAAKKDTPALKTIILSMHANDFYIEQAIQKGADGYVVKDVLEKEIIASIIAVTRGQRHFSSLPAGASAQATRDGGDDAYLRLTNREKEIFLLIAQGKQNKEIAQQLSISVRTVETHRMKIMRKLKVHTVAEMVHYAISRHKNDLPV